MSPRRKTLFEKWFSFSRHRRRFGARALASDLLEGDLEALKHTLVSGNEAEYACGSLPDLQAHLQRLRREFVGRPELLYHHAALIVLIRRESEVARNFSRLKHLWLAEQAFLSEHLDLRWLVAACDTLIDHDPDVALRAALTNAVILLNTVKLQETERFLRLPSTSADDPQALVALSHATLHCSTVCRPLWRDPTTLCATCAGGWSKSVPCTHWLESRWLFSSVCSCLLTTTSIPAFDSATRANARVGGERAYRTEIGCSFSKPSTAPIPPALGCACVE